MLASLGLLILRVGAGGLMLTSHGWAKFVGFGVNATQFPDPLGLGPQLSMLLAIFAEVGCSVLIILGAATRLAAIPLVTNMLVAAFVVHADDPWSKKEFALLYAVPFLTLIFTGAGDFSLDTFLWGRRRRRRVEIATGA